MNLYNLQKNNVDISIKFLQMQLLTFIAHFSALKSHVFLNQKVSLLPQLPIVEQLCQKQ